MIRVALNDVNHIVFSRTRRALRHQNRGHATPDNTDNTPVAANHVSDGVNGVATDAANIRPNAVLDVPVYTAYSTK